ncbi:hypothetical protein KIP88_02720 [Bradyrhizobium sp. SRL28]|uniref:hypothetical protein n=1 Tax=Bradyrhizobium sp. SRL28 TaxID=2836178 RepID=UPI001BDECA86|nr:hypothetical protein [Bradyrhizobium sp. SRL28]MBT1509404.1 hypothetical protein [Bradyrhizobium sp. SRL28]
MAEFEELRLTVNLVDSASVGLQRIRSEIGQLTQSAQTMTSGLATATTGLTSFASGVQNAQPKMRSLNTEMREMQRHAAETGRALSAMATAARDGTAGLPQIALSLYDAAGGVKGLGEAMKSLTPVARISTQALIGVGIGVVAVGAAVAAYGISMFKLAKDMDQLNRTARTMGMSFAELKNAQDQAKAFGGSAEMMVRTFQGVQQAQLDLYKSNSELRQKLVSKGVDANWVDALGVMDPTEFTNAAVKYAKSLEQQWLASGAMPAVARAQANKFLSEFGIAINLIDMPELKPPTEAAKQEAAKLAKLSKDVMDIWNPMTVKMEMIKLEALKAGLPLLKQALELAEKNIDNIKSGINAIGAELKSIGALYAAIKTPSDYEGWWADALFGKKGESSIRDILEWMAAKMGHDTSGLANTATPGELGAVGQGGNLPDFQSGTSAPVLPPEWQEPSRLQPDEVKKSIQDRFKQFGANDNVSGTRVGFMTQELTDKTEANTGQMEKLTGQLEKLNNFYERIETKGGGGFGGGGASGGWGGNYDQPNQGGPAGGFRGGRRGGGGNGDGSPAPAPSTGSAGGEGVSKADAEKIFSGGKVDGAVPATTTGGSTGYAGVGRYNFMGSPEAAAMGMGDVTPGSAAAQHKFATGIPKGKGPQEITANKYAGPDMVGFLKGLADAGAPLGDFAGVYANRQKRHGGGASQHAYGNVIDIERGFGSGPDNSPALAAWAKANPDKWRALKAQYHLRNLAPEDGAKMQDWGHLEWTPLSKAPKTDAANVGGYPSSLYDSRGGGTNTGFAASIGSRADLDRGTLNDNTKIDAKGSVKVQVGGKTASEKAADSSELFKKGSMTTIEQNPHTSTGGSSVDDVAKQYMANR